MKNLETILSNTKEIAKSGDLEQIKQDLYAPSLLIIVIKMKSTNGFIFSETKILLIKSKIS